jgi:DNA-directed RNA polymerase specialized sigma24 family protein
LLRLLVVIARRKVANLARRHGAARRDYRRLEPCDPADLDGRSAPSPSPSRLVAGRELLEAFRQRLTEEERELADLRGQGYGWAEIAAKLGGTPGARSKQLERALDRVERQLEESEAADD